MDAPRLGLLTPAKATEHIWSIIGPNLSIYWTHHAREQMLSRNLIMGDILHVLKNGHIYEQGEPATQAGFFKYRMECTTPNSDGRTLRVVVIPDKGSYVKIVTVMWKDEQRQRH